MGAVPVGHEAGLAEYMGGAVFREGPLRRCPSGDDLVDALGAQGDELGHEWILSLRTAKVSGVKAKGCDRY